MSKSEGSRPDRYRLLGRSGLRISPLCLGTMTFGTEWGWGSDEGESRRVFDLYVDHGGNFIDTANFYTGGTSESLVGTFMKGRRDKLVVATKYTLCMRTGDPNAGGNHRKSLVQSLEASLKRLQTDYIDLYWVHAWEFTTPVEEVMRALDDAVRAGKVLYAGVSNPPAWIAAQANTLADLRGWTPFVGMQIQYSLREREVERELLPMCHAFDIGVTPWSPLGGGLLTGKYARLDEGSTEDIDQSLRGDNNRKRIDAREEKIVLEVKRVATEAGCSMAQVALAWLLRKSEVTSVILGARTPAQLEDNLGSLDVELSDEQMRSLDDVSAVTLGYPHDFVSGENVQNYIFGGCDVERRT
jgi:aryl-alcohol dehydrogenase-like predicted oxidoreductase